VVADERRIQDFVPQRAGSPATPENPGKGVHLSSCPGRDANTHGASITARCTAFTAGVAFFLKKNSASFLKKSRKNFFPSARAVVRPRS
jgi:hypothetical protein